MFENSLKMASSNHRSRCTLVLGTSTRCKLIFSPSRMKSLSQHTVENEVSELARLTFYENSLIEQEKRVRCPL